MIHFPKELLFQVFKHLQTTALRTVAQVNRQWSDAARSLGVCRLDFSQINHEQLEHEMMDEIVREIPNQDEGIKIRHLVIVSHHLLPSSIFQRLQYLCPQIKSFDYDYDMLQDHGIRKNTLPQRHSLMGSTWQHSITHFPACFISGDLDDLSDESGAICDRLESLYICDNHHCFLGPNRRGSYRLFLSYLPQLTELTLDTQRKFRENIFSFLHRSCPSLVSLTLRETYLVCEFTRLSPFARRGNKILRELTLDNVVFCRSDNFDFFPMMYPYVETLVLSYPFSPFYIFSMVALFRFLKNLIVRLPEPAPSSDYRLTFLKAIQEYIGPSETRTFKLTYV